MASPALLAFLPPVLVVLLVTKEAIARQLVLVQVALVAARTLGLLVLVQKRVLGFLVVIEQNLFPVTLDVAAFALRTKLAFVGLVVLFLVAGHAGHLQLVLKQIALVAASALGFLVLADQGVFRFLVVIEQDFFPAFLDVTVLALGPEIAFVLIVLFVAIVAQDRRLAEFLFRFVTILAFNLGIGVFALQGVIR